MKAINFIHLSIFQLKLNIQRVEPKQTHLKATDVLKANYAS
jgi:hypothetical protein